MSKPNLIRTIWYNHKPVDQTTLRRNHSIFF